MRVLVIGGGGFVGSRIVLNVLKRGHDVCCMDINTSSRHLAGLEDRVQIVRGDITRFDDVARVMAMFKPDRVIHLAFQLNEAAGERDPHKAVHLNIMGTDNVFEAARICGVDRVTYASSIGVYGFQRDYGERPVTEDDYLYGVSMYRVSKIYNENVAKWYNTAYGTKFTGIRLSAVTGWDKTIGSLDHVNVIVPPARGEATTLTYGDSMRWLISVDDAAEVFAQVGLAADPKYRIYNSGGTTTSMAQLADIVKKYLPEADIRFEKDEGGKILSPIYLGDSTRIQNEFNIQFTPMDEMIKGIIDNVREVEGLPAID